MTHTHFELEHIQQQRTGVVMVGGGVVNLPQKSRLMNYVLIRIAQLKKVCRNSFKARNSLLLVLYSE